MLPSAGTLHTDHPLQPTLTTALTANARTEQLPLQRSSVDRGSHASSLPSLIADFSLEISGASGPFSDIVNGVFERTSEQCCGMSVYRKRDDGDKWLEYSSQALKWNVLDTAHRGQSWGWAAFASRAGIEKCLNVAGWKIYDGTKWVDCPDVRLTLLKSNASLLGSSQSTESQQEQQQQQQQQQKQQKQQLQRNHPSHKRPTSIVMSHRLQHTRTASQALSPTLLPKPSSPPHPPSLPQVGESALLTHEAPAVGPTVMKVHHESDNGVTTSHAIKYNQTSTAADVTSYVVRKMQLLPAAYELVFRSLDIEGNDNAVFKCKNDSLLSDAVASCSGSRGKWWVRLYQASHSELKIENEWLRKELEAVAVRQREACEREQDSNARLREVCQQFEDLKEHVRQNRNSQETTVSYRKEKALLISRVFEKGFFDNSHFQVVRPKIIFLNCVCLRRLLTTYMLQELAFVSWKNVVQKLIRSRMDVTVRWRQKQQYQLRVGFQSWSMLCRVSHDPRLRTALEVASRTQQELRLFQSAATQRFMDAEAAWRNEIEQEQEATKAASQKADNIAEDLQRTQSALEDSLGLLNQVEADKQRLIEYIKEQEQRETERMKHILRDLHRKIDENAGEREVNLQMLMTKDKEMGCLRKEVESLRSQVQLLHTCFGSV